MKKFLCNFMLILGLVFAMTSCCSMKKSCCADKSKECCDKKESCENGSCETKPAAAATSVPEVTPTPAAKKKSQ